MLQPSADQAARLLEQASGDPELAARLRSGYRGRHDVMDALWWVAHPHTTSPRGVTDPSSEMRELQRAAFSRSATESPVIDVTDPGSGATRQVPESVHRLAEAERALAEDARRLADAVEAVDVTDFPSPDAQPAIATTHGEEHPSAGGTSTRGRRKYVVLLASIAAVLAAIVVFPTLSGINADAGPEPAPTSTSPVAERVRTEIVTLGAEGNVGDPLAVLGRPMAETDQPGIRLESSFASGSFRALPELVGFLDLYLARVEDDSICLVVVHGDDSASASCLPEAEFLERGLDLGGSGRHAIEADFTILTESFTLLANGDFRYEATARTRTLGEPAESPQAPPGDVIEAD